MMAKFHLPDPYRFPPDPIDPTYSADFEINEVGIVEATRDIAVGEIVRVPLHIYYRVLKQQRPN